MTAAESTAIATWTTCAVLALTAVFIGRQVTEAIALRRQQSRPYVVVSLDVEQRVMFMIVVENVGAAPAYDLTIEFDQPPRSSIHDLGAVNMLVNPTPMLPPGRRMRAYWDQSFKILGDPDYPYPLSYRARVRYRDQGRRWYGPEEYVLDFRQYDGLARGMSGLPELVKAIEDIKNVLGKRESHP